MSRWLHKLSLYFAAGSLGALVNSIAAWLCGAYGISAALQVAIAPRLTPGWLYPRIVWGGLWGLLFLIPMVKSRFVLRGLIVSLGPTAAQLFYFFPYVLSKGMLGLKLGTLTPLLVLLLNAIWGVAAALWLRMMDRTA